MNKKRLLILFLFINFIIAGLFLTSSILLHNTNNAKAGTDTNQPADKQKVKTGLTASKVKPTSTAVPTLIAEPTGEADCRALIEEATAGFASDMTNDKNEEDSLTTSAGTPVMPKLIYDSTTIDYMDYIPEMKYDSQLKEALDITNPDLDIDAEYAILFNADTKQVMFYKNAVQPAFSASTVKLLTSIVALNWCTEDERVTIGDEITLIAPDSTRAYLKEGQVFTIKSLLEAMLLPSGNDAAYALAAYVGRKSLDNPEATKEEAVTEFVRLMNNQAKELGVKNSCFKTPDGYDAVGQYTTAYDMGLIGMAATEYGTITEITGLSSVRTTLLSGEDVTWDSTDKLVTRYSGEYYSPAIGLKTGTSTMAGRCMVAAAKQNGKKVVCVILHSTITGRWEDAIKLLKYGLNDTE